MKVTKGETSLNDRKVVAFYTGAELVFRDKHSNKNYALFSNTIYKGNAVFDEYLEMRNNVPGFITFYKGDIINIQL